MVKNPFKKNSIIDTAINVGTGGAANVIVDMAIESVLPNTDEMYINAGKFIGGVVLGSMVGKSQMLRAAADGIATVGVSNLVKTLVSDGFGGSSSVEGAAGFKNTAMGRVRPGHARLSRRIKRRGSMGSTPNPIMG